MERFFAKVKKTESCWNWNGGTRGENGYGAIKIAGKVKSAHKYSYILHKGDVPENLSVSHTCHNKLCVNPEHLILVTKKENYDNAVKRGTIKPNMNEHLKKHPSLSAYKNGCRCSECTSLQTTAVREFRRKKKERKKKK